jgi:hypothetical protein
MSKKKKIKPIKVKLDVTKLRNELHFEVQKSTRANVFRDRTKYCRKKKHKNKDE